MIASVSDRAGRSIHEDCFVTLPENTARQRHVDPFPEKSCRAWNGHARSQVPTHGFARRRFCRTQITQFQMRLRPIDEAAEMSRIMPKPFLRGLQHVEPPPLTPAEKGE